MVEMRISTPPRASSPSAPPAASALDFGALVEVDAILDAIPQPLLIVDRDGALVQWNRAAAALGLARREVPLGQWTEALGLFRDDEETPLRTEELPVSRALGGMTSEELKIFVRNAKTPAGVHLAVSARPLLDAEGHPRGAVLSMRDIGEARRWHHLARRSEERLHTLLNTTPSVAIETYDRKGRVVTWNRAAERIFGWTAQEALGKTLDQLTLDAESTAEFERMLQQVATTGAPTRPVEWTCRRPDGDEVRIYSTIFALPALNGEVELMCMDVDVTARHQAELRLRRHASQVEASALFAERLEAAGLEWNSVIETICRAVREVTGDGCAVLLPTEDAAAFDGYTARPGVPGLEHRRVSAPHLLDRVLAGRPSTLTCTGVDELPAPAALACGLDVGLNGPCSIVAAPLQLGREVAGVLMIGRRVDAGGSHDPERVALCTDLARRAGMALDNARLYREAEDALRIREEFLSVASHELRTPVTALELQLELLLRMQANAREIPRDRLELARAQVLRLARLVDQLLDVSRISAGRLQLDVDRFDLGDAAREIAARLRDQARRVGSTIEVSVGCEAVGAWDRGRIEQVLTNLVTNAIKYGQGQPIEIDVQRSDEYARVSVHDHGIGISPDDQARVFAQFERAVPQRRYGGLGLGLWIVRQIVEAHGGTVRVDSTPGAGSTFVVELPLVHTDEQPASAASSREATA